MMRLLSTLAAVTILSCGTAPAQVGGLGLPPLGFTSPLGIGPAPSVAPTGVPLGATELASPGVSPMTSGTSPLPPSLGTITTCSNIGGSLAQASSSPGNPAAGMPSSTATSVPGTSGVAATSGTTTVF